jgi:adenylate cyclase
MPERTASWKQKLRRSLRQIGWLRLGATLLFLLLAVYVARSAWDIRLASDAERALYDLRFGAKATRVLEQDRRITLVTYNDDTLAQLG